ncbi:MAG: serine hydrolase, partial [bacterium]|nr:serine hydrolase [bacterium]
MKLSHAIYTITFSATLFLLGLPAQAAAQSTVLFSERITAAEFAAGALIATKDQDIRIAPAVPRTAFAELITPAYYPAIPLDKTLVSNVYHFAVLPATENKLSTDLAVTLKYPPSEERFKEIYLYNQELGLWQHLAGSIDPATSEITASTNWASGFVAVFADHVARSEYLKERLESPSIFVADARTGEILIERGSDIVRPIASLTKLMTAAEFLEHNPGWSAPVALKASDDTIPAKIYANAGEVFTAHDLFYATLLKSANNAARALARSTGLSSTAFVSAMNQKASDLGMENTRYAEPTGLSEENISTAKDVYTLSRHVFSDMAFLKATTPKTLTIASVNSGKRHVLENSNKAIDVPYVVIGSKTGFTYEAGRCLVMKARNKEGREVIAVTLGGGTPGA